MDWNAHVQDQFKTTATRAGLKPEIIRNLASEELIRRAAGATLLVASLDGTADDALVHYICGAILAKPKAGTGRTLSRMILLLEQPGIEGRSLVADSLRRCDENVHVIGLEQIKAETEKFLKAYTAWATSDPNRKK